MKNFCKTLERDFIPCCQARSIFSIFLLLIAVVSVPARSNDFVIHAGHLITNPNDPMRERVSIIVNQGRVSDIQDGYIDGENVIDLSSQYVLPGLIDMHAHVTIPDGAEKDPHGTLLRAYSSDKAKLALETIPRLSATLREGFTTVRNLGDPAGVIFDVRDAVNRGIITGPRILAAQNQVSVSNGEYDPAKLRLRGSIEERVDAGGLCNGPYVCRRVVRTIVAQGADVIKLRIAGNGHFFGHDNVYEFDDELEAIIETAHKLGKKVAVHAGSQAGAEAALKAGADTIEHGPLSKSAMKLAKGTAYFTPTLGALEVNRELFLKMTGRDMYEEALQNTREAYQNGVPILFGSDSGAVPHGNIAREFSLLVEAGLSPADAISSATITAAEALGLEGLIGTIEPGKYADVIAVGTDPLESVSALEQVIFVMKNGIPIAASSDM